MHRHRPSPSAATAASIAAGSPFPRPERPDRPVRRRKPRPTLAAAGLGLLALLLMTACGSGDDIVGSGPIRSVAVAPDGSLFVLRDWRRRTPETAVLLSVDPRTGRAAPVLPRLPGRRGATIGAIDFAVPRPAGAAPWSPVDEPGAPVTDPGAPNS